PDAGPPLAIVRRILAAHVVRAADFRRHLDEDGPFDQSDAILGAPGAAALDAIAEAVLVAIAQPRIAVCRPESRILLGLIELDPDWLAPRSALQFDPEFVGLFLGRDQGGEGDRLLTENVGVAGLDLVSNAGCRRNVGKGQADAGQG